MVPAQQDLGGNSYENCKPLRSELAGLQFSYELPPRSLRREPHVPEAEGHELQTIEGMAQGDTLHPLQQKFLEIAALQCGICTSGMLVASDALLKKNSTPSEEEVRFWLAGNLCRCTGYDKIVRAVMETADDMRGTAQ